MKIPLLHQLEKFIRKIIRKKRRFNSDVSSSFYKRQFLTFLEDNDFYTQKTTDVYFEFKKHLQPLVSIIIPCYNQYKHTVNCINSIIKNTPDSLDFEIILIDDCSDDETNEIQSIFPSIEYIKNQENLGFLRSVNRASEIAKGSYLLLLNNDTLVLRNWLSSLLEVFEADETVGAVGSKLIFPNGMMQEAGGYISKDGHFGNVGRFNSIFDPAYNYIKEVDYVSAACLLVKKDLWDNLGGFDGQYSPAYFEDTDLCMGIRSLGFKVMYTPFSNIIHLESVSYEKNNNSKKHFQMEKNKVLFLQKWEKQLCEKHSLRNEAIGFNFERINNKPVILYVDEEMPNDFSCGSKLSKLYCTILIELGFVVKYVPMNVRPKDLEYYKELSRLGVEVALFADGYNRIRKLNTCGNGRDSFQYWYDKRKDSIDFVLLCRKSSHEYLEIISEGKRNFEYFYHPADLHFLRLEREIQYLSLNQMNSRVNSFDLKSSKSIELKLLRNAKKVLHLSTFEQNYLKVNHSIDNGIIIPCLFFNIENLAPVIYRRDDLLFVGSRHHASVDGIQWFIKEIFPKVIKKYPSIKLNIVGACGEEIKPGNNIIIHGMLPEEEMVALYKKCVVVIPLRFGAGVKGKTLEAMNYGSPFVSTSIGLEGIVSIESAKIGFNTTEEFSRELCLLLEDVDYQNKDLLACHKIISKYFTKKKAVSVLKEVFEIH